MEIFQLGKIANCYFSLYYIKDDVDVSMIYVNYLTRIFHEDHVG